MNEYHDKVILVTGAGRGIGRAIACAFARQGAIVAANDITPVNLDETITLLTSAGGRGRAYQADVAKKIPVQTMINQIVDDWGRIDILINNAGVEPHASLLELDDDRSSLRKHHLQIIASDRSGNSVEYVSYLWKFL